VVAVGDIACAPGARRTRAGCRQGDTARLTRRLDSDAVIALGDLQYDMGSLRAFRRSYARSWGSLRDITHPVPGNHEYLTRRAAGYYRYFRGRQPGQPGWYAVNLGRWRAYLLNSNCTRVDCAAEAAWLRRDLADHPRTCSLIATHHPRYSSGTKHGSDPRLRGFFRIAFRHRVELFLSGHDHDYERFRPLDHAGRRVARGVVQIVSGTGGKSLYRLGRRPPASVHAEDGRFGVLHLTLKPGSYDLAFKTTGGKTPDSASRRCR
jgi:3',5'-cyclic AMP phosphodiesterase CpdA